MDDRPAFDAAKFKTTTRAQWQAAADAWHNWGPFLGQWLGPATDRCSIWRTSNPAIASSTLPPVPANNRSLLRAA